MFCVYIIYSAKLNRYYTGTTDNFSKRLNEHNAAMYNDAFTVNGIPWITHIVIDNLSSKQALNIERHIKKMKSQQYIQNLLIYPDIIQKLILKYKES
jgi:putative endonuclease